MSKNILFVIIVLTLTNCNNINDDLIKTSAYTELGFYYPYFLFIPKEDTNFLIVESNNTGFTSDDFQDHFESAEKLITNDNNLGNFLSNEAEILAHGKATRDAFFKGDIAKIRSLHHPEVIKALGYNDLKNGREEVIESIKNILENYKLEFVENIVESILIFENLAIEQTLFSISGIPLKGGEPFVFSGRTSVTYVRYDQSPTGWAAIREIIQPATD